MPGQRQSKQPRWQPVPKVSGRSVTVTDSACQTVRIAAAVDRGSRGAACKSRQRCAPPLADFDYKPGGIRGIWRGKRRYELSFSGGQNPLFWLIVGMITSEPGAAGSPRITQVPCWHIVIGSLPFQAVETAAPKKARSTIESRNKWVPQLHEPRPVRVGATCVVFRWPSAPTRGVASGVAALRSLHWQLRSYSGPETCGGHSIPGIVPVLPSSEAVTKAVGGRSAGGMETSSGSLRRGTCDAVNEPSSTGRIQGMDRVTA